MTHDNTDNNGPRDADEHLNGLDALDADLERFEGVELNAQLAAELNDFMDIARKTGKEIDNDRAAIKKPFWDGGKAVDARFKPLTDRVAKMVKDAKAILSPYLVEQARIAAEAERKAREEAEAKEREAAMLAQDKTFGDVAQQDAEEAKARLTLASAQADSAGRAGSASGMARAASLRTYYDATVTDAVAAATHYADHPKMTDMIIQLAQADMRSDETKSLKIAGVQFNKRQEAA